MWKKALSVLVSCCALVALAVVPGAASGAAATKSPVKIGIIGVEGAALNIPGVRVGAVATVKYANAELGGLAGHKITYVTCKLDETNPATARTCANRMVQEKVAAVIHPVTGMGEVVIPILAGAKIPTIQDHTGSPQQLTNKYSFIMSPGDPGWALSMVKEAKARGYKRMMLIIIDDGGVQKSYTDLMNKYAPSRGVKVSIVGLKPTVPDAAAAITAAASDKPQVVAYLVASAGCITAVKATDTAGLNVPRWYGPECTGPEVKKALGATAFYGPEASVWDFFDSHSNSPSAKLYRKVMAKYAPGDASIARQYGYNAVLSLVRGMSGHKGTVNSASITTRMRNTPIASPGGHGIKLDCKAAPLGKAYPNLCGQTFLIAKINKDGTYKYKVVK